MEHRDALGIHCDPSPTDNNFIILLYCYLPDLPVASPITFCSIRSVLVSHGNNVYFNL